MGKKQSGSLTSVAGIGTKQQKLDQKRYQHKQEEHLRNNTLSIQQRRDYLLLRKQLQEQKEVQFQRRKAELLKYKDHDGIRIISGLPKDKLNISDYDLRLYLEELFGAFGVLFDHIDTITIDTGILRSSTTNDDDDDDDDCNPN